MPLAGKTLLVTGGNSGIGLATALRFARDGAAIGLFSRRADKNEDAKAQIEALGAGCVTIEGDVTREDDVRRAVASVVKAFGGLDYAFNCAGMMQTVSSIEELGADEFSALMDCNARGTFLSMKYEIPAMRARGGGAIVNCSSTAGITPSAMQVGYAAAKFAVMALTRGTAMEVARDNIRVNVVCPGATTGEMWFRYLEADPDRAAAALAKHPLGRIGKKEEVADAVLFLCRDATFTTGATLTVDGGRTAG